MPNLFDIVMNSMQILQYELGNFKSITADVLINPDLSDFTWIEYYRADELIARGAEAAQRALPAIEKAIDGQDRADPAGGASRTVRRREARRDGTCTDAGPATALAWLLVFAGLRSSRSESAGSRGSRAASSCRC